VEASVEMIKNDDEALETVLITGGAGYIGSNLANRLAAARKKVLVIDNLYSGLIENLTEQVFFIEGNVGNKALLQKIFSENEIQTVFHFAARKSVPESTEKPRLYMKENVENTRILLEVMNEHNCTALVFASTAAVYGDREVTKEGYAESDTPLPTNPYGLSKLLAEQRIIDATKCSSLRAISFRFFNVGMSESLMNPYMGEDLLSVLTDCYLSSKVFEIFGNDYPTLDGTCYRDFIHISDLLDALELSQDFLKLTPDQFTVFNLGSGNGISLGQVATLGSQILGERFSYEYSARRPGDIPYSLANISLSRNTLNWHPKFSPQVLFSLFFEKLKAAQ